MEEPNERMLYGRTFGTAMGTVRWDQVGRRASVAADSTPSRSRTCGPHWLARAGGPERDLA